MTKLNECFRHGEYDKHFRGHDNFRGHRTCKGSHDFYKGTTGGVTTYRSKKRYPKGTNGSIRRMARAASLD